MLATAERTIKMNKIFALSFWLLDDIWVIGHRRTRRLIIVYTVGHSSSSLRQIYR